MNQRLFTFPVMLFEEKLKLTPFTLKRNTIYYGSLLNPVILEDQSQLKLDLEKKSFDFISLLEILHFPGLLQIASYYFPYVELSALNIDEVKDSLTQNLFSLIGLDKDVREAFIFRDYKNIYAYSIENLKDIDAFLNKELEEIINSEVIEYNHGSFFSPFEVEDIEEHIKLDDITKLEVQEIFNKLEKLNKSAQFLAILPFIEKQIQVYKTEQDLPVSDLFIDENFRIFLTDYQNKEVKLSHLTKSLYFLFLMKGSIDLVDLDSHKNDLFCIYKHISNQENLEKMEESIENLVKNENHEIFVHFSRIKSAFSKIISENLALNYYITGLRNKPKSISISKLKTNIYSLQEICFPNDNRFSTKLHDNIIASFRDVF